MTFLSEFVFIRAGSIYLTVMFPERRKDEIFGGFSSEIFRILLVNTMPFFYYFDFHILFMKSFVRYLLNTFFINKMLNYHWCF